MLRHIAFRRIGLHALAAVVFVLGPGGDVCAQVPAWPTPVATTTPMPAPGPPPPAKTPSPAAEPPAPTATPTPSSTPAEIQEEPAPTPAPETAETATTENTEGPAVDEEPGDEPSAEVPEKEQEINPGDVAFTDYEPFDLDDIEYEPTKDKWKNFVAGMRGMTRYSLFDGKLKFRLGGKLQVDGTAGSDDLTWDDPEIPEEYSPVNAGFDLRRALIYGAGRIGKFNFSVGFEFGADWGIDSAWIEGSEGGLEVWGAYLGKLRVGYVSEPFSLERQTSSYNGGFLERSLPVQTIAPGSNVGAMVHDSGRRGRFSWAAGLFSLGQSNDNNASNSVLSLTGRGTYLPVYRDQGRHLFHVGLSLSSRSPSGGDVRYRSRPEARFVNYLVDTEPMEASHTTLVGIEAALVRGPLWGSAEFIQSEVAAQLVGDPKFRGSYVQVGWFMTGENRPYRTNSGTFDRLRPLKKYRKGNPFKKKNGGAWEIVGRISRVDLNSGEINGGELTDFSAALNWYLNATTRVSLNYVHARPEDRGTANLGLLRIQFQPW